MSSTVAELRAMEQTALAQINRTHGQLRRNWLKLLDIVRKLLKELAASC